ncbi:YdaS antitoxin of YdaST toxin-antitoxin system [Orbus hercynius]|uniref:YdaS antitoxin of YdaST toxin-antitoxin system n=1 Tax=Orbus hercynius TaxID=593135 RepID=A0A495RJ32_9GAMM|nr:helix-turn-helix domain-containing protein [Orbus hercynius]RKS87300.1 YdaS antitoxin of YdaST toxin-antitoxin system [Orbus hercynius]
MSILQEAIKRTGSQRAFAKICGVSQPAVSNWLKGKSKIGEDKAMLVEIALDGEITCEELRPDVNWSVLRNKKATKRN